MDNNQDTSINSYYKLISGEPGEAFCIKCRKEMTCPKYLYHMLS